MHLACKHSHMTPIQRSTQRSQIIRVYFRLLVYSCIVFVWVEQELNILCQAFYYWRFVTLDKVDEVKLLNWLQNQIGDL